MTRMPVFNAGELGRKAPRGPGSRPTFYQRLSAEDLSRRSLPPTTDKNPSELGNAEEHARGICLSPVLGGGGQVCCLSWSSMDS